MHDPLVIAPIILFAASALVVMVVFYVRVEAALFMREGARRCLSLETQNTRP